MLRSLAFVGPQENFQRNAQGFGKGNEELAARRRSGTLPSGNGRLPDADKVGDLLLRKGSGVTKGRQMSAVIGLFSFRRSGH